MERNAWLQWMSLQASSRIGWLPEPSIWKQAVLYASQDSALLCRVREYLNIAESGKGCSFHLNLFSGLFPPAVCIFIKGVYNNEKSVSLTFMEERQGAILEAKKTFPVSASDAYS